MTEKRFVADNEYVMQDNEVYVVCGGEHSADVVATALNELFEKNDELQSKLDYHQRHHQKWKSECLANIEENEQLKHDATVLIQANQDYRRENEQLQARNKYLATKIQRERNIHVKEHEKWEKEIQKENEQLKSDLRYWQTLAQSLAKKNNVGGFE